MKKTSAEWDAKLIVDCPYCDEFQFIELRDEWWEDFGIPCQSTEDLDYVHQCEDCKKEFIIESTSW